MNDHDEHRHTNETFSSRNTGTRMILGIGFHSVGLLAACFLALSAIDMAPRVWAEVAHVARSSGPVARYDLTRSLWDQKLDRLIENLTPD